MTRSFMITTLIKSGAAISPGTFYPLIAPSSITSPTPIFTLGDNQELDNVIVHLNNNISTGALIQIYFFDAIATAGTPTDSDLGNYVVGDTLTASGVLDFPPLESFKIPTGCSVFIKSNGAANISVQVFGRIITF